ncbi:MAG: hypothetical protein HRT59_26615, partial [Crocosphaera sp.]|nr:hypothetical protein [Crocosphaera sp.]
MSRRKKNFPCGHKGYGQRCHRCAQEQMARNEKQQQKNAWEETFSKDTIRPLAKVFHGMIKSYLFLELATVVKR